MDRQGLLPSLAALKVVSDVVNASKFRLSKPMPLYVTTKLGMGSCQAKCMIEQDKSEK